MANTSEALASTLAVIPVVGRVDLARVSPFADGPSGAPQYRQTQRGDLLGEAIYTMSGLFAHVLVVWPVSASWFTRLPIQSTSPQSDDDFLAAITAFDRILIHDLLCPPTDPEFLRELAAAEGPATAAVTPLVETVKVMRGDLVVRTLDRDRLRMVTSPVVVDRRVLAEVPDVLEALSDFAVLVSRLQAITTVALAPAPFGTVRVSDVADLRVLALRGSS